VGVQAATREKVLARLRRIGGQVAGIERMVREDRYCVDVLHQVAAVEAALDRVGKLILTSHIETCVTDALAAGDARARQGKLRELFEVFTRLGRIGGR
jgi:DNA-binding FrmR family transcriptional regulator